MAVHYAGVACEMDVLTDIARRRGIALLEDAAQALMCSYDGRPLGSFGEAAAVSFHETKNLVAGEGGALLVNDPEWVERAEILHEKGTNRSRFFRGEIDKYTWVDIGSSFLMSEIAAAFLWAQLEHGQSITERRLALWGVYHDALRELEDRELLRRPVIPARCVHNAHMYYILLPSEEARARVITDLREEGAHAVFHYVPLHSSPAGRRFGRAHGDLSVTDDVTERLLRLPLWPDMSYEDVERIVQTIERCLSRSGLTRSAS
jgi:dTDP-4-amino-4,6-dideoxygalactose transaminase